LVPGLWGLTQVSAMGLSEADVAAFAVETDVTISAAADATVSSRAIRGRTRMRGPDRRRDMSRLHCGCGEDRAAREPTALRSTDRHLGPGLQMRARNMAHRDG
jgi:hypothetical protein